MRGALPLLNPYGLQLTAEHYFVLRVKCVDI